MDNTLHLVGIAKKARRVEVGEEPVGAAARAWVSGSVDASRWQAVATPFSKVMVTVTSPFMPLAEAVWVPV